MAAISAGVEVSREEKTVAMCETQMNSSAKVAFMLVLTILFFVLPLFLLLGLYLVIVRHLVKDSSTTSSCGESYQARARRQVVLMLLTVVFSFFVCLAPFRLLTLFVVLSPDGALDLGMEAYYNLLYFGRIMFYLNSAINPILYNLMSSRFRIGFLKLCGIRKPRRVESNTFRSTVTASRPSRWATRKEGHHENVV